MFTANYKTLKQMQFFAASSYKFKEVNGQTITAYSQYNHQADIGYSMANFRVAELPTAYATSVNNAYPGVHVGTDPTPATENDYKLGAPITSGLSYSNGAVLTQKEADGRYSIFSQFVVGNTTDSDIHIWEIGMITPVNIKSSDSGNYWPVLMERTVFAEPVTLHPGEQKLLVYKLTFNQTLNVEA